MTHMELVKSAPVYGYVVLHGDLSALTDDDDAIEVVVGDDGAPFETAYDALVYAKVSCSEPWRVVAVRTADRMARASVTSRRAS